MKPGAFEYCRPETADEALDLLAEFGDDAVILAGGLSLGAMLNMRLVRPAAVIDINRLGGDLERVEAEAGGFRSGALVRQADIFASPLAALPLLTAALPHIGHYQTRSRGTLAGSVAHADPSAEIPLVLATLGGSVELASASATRIVPARDFAEAALVTARAGDEMIVALHWPKPSAGSGAAFLEISARRGDFALVAAAALARRSPDGSIALDLGLGGVEERPRVFSAAFDGAPAKAAAFTDDFLARSLKILTPIGDLRVSADYRRHLAQHLGRQAVIAALGQVAPGKAG